MERPPQQVFGQPFALVLRIFCGLLDSPASSPSAALRCISGPVPAAVCAGLSHRLRTRFGGRLQGAVSRAGRSGTIAASGRMRRISFIAASGRLFAAADRDEFELEKLV